MQTRYSATMKLVVFFSHPGEKVLFCCTRTTPAAIGRYGRTGGIWVLALAARANPAPVAF
jgi:hypothetical protein